MLRRISLAAMAALALFVTPPPPADAKTFKYAFQGDLNALDPHT